MSESEPVTLTYEPQSTPSPTRSRISFSPEYLKTVPGILKIVEIILSLLTFICSCIDTWEAAGWAQFQSAFAVFATSLYLVLYLLNLITRLPGPWPLIEFIYYMIFTACFVITAIAAAAQATSEFPSIAATAFFAFGATSVFAVDTFFHFRAWRTGQIAMRTTTMTTNYPEELLAPAASARY